MMSFFIPKRNYSNFIYDLCIIGGGPGGFNSALRGAQHGLKTICIDNNKLIGGISLNDGVLASKILLKAASLLNTSKTTLKKYGITPNKKFKINISQLMKTKNEILNNYSENILKLFNKNNIKYLNGYASFLDCNTVMINHNPKNVIKSKKFILATGTRIKNINNINFDEKRILSSNGILNIGKIPKNLFVIGGGVLGIELANAFHSFGSQIHIIDYQNKIIDHLDYEIREKFTKILLRENYKLHLNQKLIDAFYINQFKKDSDNNIELITEDCSNKKKRNYRADYLLICNNRIPNTDRLNLDKVNVQLDKNGKVIIDENYKSSNENIYAIGDIIPGITLANTAINDGINCVDLMMDKYSPKKHSFKFFPSACYTNPEIGSIGYTEQDLINKKIKYKKGIVHYDEIAKARTGLIDKDGLIKVLTSENGSILGAHILGENSGELIHEIALGMECGLKEWDIGKMIHSYPTLSEGIREAFLRVMSKEIQYNYKY